MLTPFFHFSAKKPLHSTTTLPKNKPKPIISKTTTQTKRKATKENSKATKKPRKHPFPLKPINFIKSGVITDTLGLKNALTPTASPSKSATEPDIEIIETSKKPTTASDKTPETSEPTEEPCGLFGKR